MSRMRDRIREHLRVFVEDVGARPPGSPANARATEYARTVLADSGMDVVDHPFTTRWWEPGTGRLATTTTTLDVIPNPYSPPASVAGRLRHATRLEDLERLTPSAESILVIGGELAREQVMPAAFPFLDLPEHARIRAALHRLAPTAIIAVSDHWQPILEDADLPFPSTTVPVEASEHLPEGAQVELSLGGAVHEGHGSTLATRVSSGATRVVLSAHLDSKATTPGAFDNAASVATVLALAEAGAVDTDRVEIVLFNGEDHFDACGEVAWLAATDLDEVGANLNLDGAGLAGHRTSLATLACPERLEQELTAWVAQHAGWVRAAPWYESDHAIFAMRGIPAVAVTTEDVHQLLGGLAHSPADTLDVLDLAILEGLAEALPELLDRLTATSRP